MINLISFKFVNTRKPHNCWGCKELMPAGTRMMAVVEAEDDRIGTTYWCEVCNVFLNFMTDCGEDDRYGYGELLLYDDHPKNVHKESANNG